MYRRPSVLIVIGAIIVIGLFLLPSSPFKPQSSFVEMTPTSQNLTLLERTYTRLINLPCDGKNTFETSTTLVVALCGDSVYYQEEIADPSLYFALEEISVENKSLYLVTEEDIDWEKMLVQVWTVEENASSQSQCNLAEFDYYTCPGFSLVWERNLHDLAVGDHIYPTDLFKEVFSHKLPSGNPEAIVVEAHYNFIRYRFIANNTEARSHPFWWTKAKP